MKLFLAIYAFLGLTANAEPNSAANVYEAAQFFIQAQELSNAVQSQNSNGEYANRTNIELQKLGDAIQSFRTAVSALAQGLEDPSLSTPDVVEAVDSLIEVAVGALSQVDMGAEIIACIVDLNNQIGNLVSSKVQIFYSYILDGGDAVHCFANGIPDIIENISDVAASVSSAFTNLNAANSEEVQALITQIEDTLTALTEEPSLLQILSTVTELAFEGISSSFGQGPIADLKTATQAIVSDISSRLDLIKNEIEECTEQ